VLHGAESVAVSPVAVVEDSDEDFAALRRALRGATYGDADVVRFGSGDEALAGLTSGDVRPALVLLDLNLPGRSGLEVLASLKADPSARAVPVVVVSGSTLEEDVEAAYDLGASAFVAKSLDFAELRRRLLSLVEFWSVAKLPRRSADAG
jgi:CheY-like chemotaxis protein